MVLQDFGGHESRGSNQPPGPLSGGKLTDPQVRQFHQDRLQSKSTRGNENGILGHGEPPYENIVTLEVSVDDGAVVEVVDGLCYLQWWSEGEGDREGERKS